MPTVLANEYWPVWLSVRHFFIRLILFSYLFTFYGWDLRSLFQQRSGQSCQHVSWQLHKDLQKTQIKLTNTVTINKRQTGSTRNKHCCWILYIKVILNYDSCITSLRLLELKCLSVSNPVSKLRSSSSTHLAVSRVRLLIMGSRASSCSFLQLWNSLLPDLHNTDSLFKTYLLQCANSLFHLLTFLWVTAQKGWDPLLQC